MAPLSFLKHGDKASTAQQTPPPPFLSSGSGGESPTGRSFSARLLRRRPSVSAKSVDTSSTSEVASPVPTSSSSQFTESPGLPREPPRRGSESAVPSEPWGRVGVVVINAGPSRTTGHPFITQMSQQAYREANGLFQEPDTLTPAPVYPTALSPPRRPMPKSPRAGRSVDSPTPPSPTRLFTTTPTRPTAMNAEWLSRKPSTGRRRNPSLGSAAPIRSSRDRTISSSSGEASTSGLESEDGDVGYTKQMPINVPSGGPYEVEVGCVDARLEDEEEIKWVVTIRRKKPTSEPPLPPSSPLQLSTASSVAYAPSTASSINLSLSLDQPTGKLVFIAFPMDIQATPRRKPGPLKSATPTRRPITPPPRDLAHKDTPPPAPNPNHSSPPTTPPELRATKRISESSMWPSPSKSGRRSPSVGSSGVTNTSTPSPRSSEVWTPRRTRMVSANELNGGLYATGTVDGMSEELESTTLDSPPRITQSRNFKPGYI